MVFKTVQFTSSPEILLSNQEVVGSGFAHSFKLFLVSSNEIDNVKIIVKKCFLCTCSCLILYKQSFQLFVKVFNELEWLSDRVMLRNWGSSAENEKKLKTNQEMTLFKLKAVVGRRTL